MSKNTTSFLNRIGIFLYSTLISGLSAANRLRTHAAPKVVEPTLATVSAEMLDQDSGEVKPDTNRKITWTSISQAFIALTIWMVMGFAAGFLIGMIRPW